MTAPLLVTFWNRGPRPPFALASSGLPLPRWVADAVNVAADDHATTWDWLSKPRALLRWLSKPRAPVRDDRLLVVVDAADVSWAGCSAADFVSRWRQIVNASRTADSDAGASLVMADEDVVVFGAELGCDYHVPHPPGCAGMPDVPPRWRRRQRSTILRWAHCAAGPGGATGEAVAATTAAATAAAAHARASSSSSSHDPRAGRGAPAAATSDDAAGAAADATTDAERFASAAGACSTPPQLKFLNGGGFAGRARAVRRLLRTVLAYPARRRVSASDGATPDDQVAFNEYWIEQLRSRGSSGGGSGGGGGGGAGGGGMLGRRRRDGRTDAARRGRRAAHMLTRAGVSGEAERSGGASGLHVIRRPVMVEANVVSNGAVEMAPPPSASSSSSSGSPVIALDYGAELFLNMWRIDRRALQRRASDGALVPRWAEWDAPSCFVHGNGGAFNGSAAARARLAVLAGRRRMGGAEATGKMARLIGLLHQRKRPADGFRSNSTQHRTT